MDKNTAAPTSQGQIAWTPVSLMVLDTLLCAARDKGNDSVFIEGHEILVSYGKYLSDWLHSEFGAQMDEIKRKGK